MEKIHYLPKYGLYDIELNFLKNILKTDDFIILKIINIKGFKYVNCFLDSVISEIPKDYFKIVKLPKIDLKYIDVPLLEFRYVYKFKNKDGIELIKYNKCKILNKYDKWREINIGFINKNGFKLYEKSQEFIHVGNFKKQLIGAELID